MSDDKKLYKVTFYRNNTATKPMMVQEVDILFRTSNPDPSEESDLMYEELWKQHPALLSSNGPSNIGFRGWSSVMLKGNTLVEVELVKENRQEDLTGEGNLYTPLTYHPLLPYDARVALKRAYMRGVKDTTTA